MILIDSLFLSCGLLHNHKNIDSSCLLSCVVFSMSLSHTHSHTHKHTHIHSSLGVNFWGMIWRHLEWQLAVALHSTGHWHCPITGGCPLIFPQKSLAAIPKLSVQPSAPAWEKKNSLPWHLHCLKATCYPGVFWDIWQKAMSHARQRHARKHLNITQKDTWTHILGIFHALGMNVFLSIHLRWNIQTGLVK